MRIPAQKLFVVLAIAASATGVVCAEEFKYYVWIDEEGIVHAEEEAPKGRDYQVRIIEDINANVVPTEDFRPYGDVPLNDGSETTTRTVESAPAQQSSEDGSRDATSDEPAEAGQQ